MDPIRFDRLSKRLATRWTRRQAIATGGGLAASSLLAGRLRSVSAQDATPIATPAGTPSDPHPSADDAHTPPEFLFVQPFDGGSWTPKADGVYTLTLTGAAAHTTYFSDRPERITGLAPNQRFLNGLGFGPDNPPNAALVAQTETGEQDVLVVELLSPVYDADGATLTYEAKVLGDYGGPGLAPLARQQTDYELASTFGEGSLFIDDCPDGTLNCRLPDTNGSGNNTLIGSTPIGYCWSYLDVCCSPCTYTWTQQCAAAFVDCNNGNGIGACDGDVTGGQYSCS